MKAKRYLRVLSIILCALLLIPLFPMEAKAAGGVVEVSDMETFKQLMTHNGDVNICLTADLFEQHGYVDPFDTGLGLVPVYYSPLGWCNPPTGEHTGDYGYKMSYWLTLGSGTKKVDLNGHSLVVDYPNLYESVSTMFLINAGTDLTISDSTGQQGYIHYEGYIFDVDDYDVNIHYFATNMTRHLFQVKGGSLTINGGTLEAGRSKKQWVTNAHPMENGTVNQHKSYTGNVTKSVNGSAVTVNSGSLRINGGVLLGRGEYLSVISAFGGSVRILEANLDARGGARCLAVTSDAELTIVSGVFCIHANDVVYDGRSTGIDSHPYVYHYGKAGSLGFGREDLQNGDKVSASFMDPNPPRHWMVPNSIVKGDGFDLWNALVSPGQETFMLIQPVSHDADIDFMAAPGHFEPTINTDSVVVQTNYTPLFGEVAKIRNKPVYIWCFYDVYDFETMTVLGHYNAPVNSPVDLCQVMPGLSDQFQEGRTYAVFATVIEQYEGACRYEPRTVCCNLFNATSHQPITITKQPGPARYVANRKGGEVTLTATAANATDAYWEMIEPYHRRLEPTTFQNGTATLTVPVEYEATYRCQFTNPYYYSAVHDTYTYIETDEVEVAYMPAFELGYNQAKYQTAVQGGDTAIYLWHNGQEDTGQPFYGWDYGQAGMYAWYKDGVKLTIDGTHYEAAAYWGGGLALKIHNVAQADAGFYECRCDPDIMPFGSGYVELEVLESAGRVFNVALTGIKDRYVGDLPPDVSSIRTDDVRICVIDMEWTNLDEGEHIAADSYYSITVEATYGATFDEELTWDMDGSYMDIALVSEDCKTATLVDIHKYEGRGDYGEEDDTVILNQTSFTIYQGQYYPLNEQFRVNKLNCPSAHTLVLGYAHEIGSVEVADDSGVPFGIRIQGDGFCGQVLADPGVYKATLRYTIADAETGEVHNTCDVGITFTVLAATGDPVAEIEHVHTFDDWTSDGPNTHSAVCTDCGESMWFPHNWDDGEVGVIPTKSADGTMVYTCKICGESRTESLAYEDYKPPFPEVSELTFADGTATIQLFEYSGDASDVLLVIAAYNQAGALMGAVTASPDKTCVVTAGLPAQAKRVAVFVLNRATLTPLSAPFSRTVN